ncbi:MAG: Sodium/proline symporter [Pseudomonadota bacterium]
MLIAAVCGYLVCTVLLGVYASRRVHGAKDFMVAGRALPLYMNFACVFATWFGAETLLSVSAEFSIDGLRGVPGDPFGASACLMLVAIFFARAFYRLNLLTIGDFFRVRYGSYVEVATSLAIVVSYLGWTSAQMTAFGLVMYVLAQGAVTLNEAIVLGSVVVAIYTVFGGMWSVALTDLLQTAVIVVGLLIVAAIFGEQANGPLNVISQARAEGKFHFFPAGGWSDWLPFISAFLTFALGSIPQQDIFQRVTSARDAKTAVTGTLLGGLFYLGFAFVPMFIGYAALMIDPSAADIFSSDDSREVQRLLPELVLRRTPVWTQVLFFGALLSAILSTASGTLLAPSSLFTENVVKPFCKNISDSQLLLAVRGSLIGFACIATCIAVNSTSTMYEMVQSAYKVTLVAAFVPLAFGVYWKRASTQGAICAVVMGLGSWLLGEFYLPEGSDHPWAVLTPQLLGLTVSVIGMVVGSLAPQLSAADERERVQPNDIGVRVAEMLQEAEVSEGENAATLQAPARASKNVSPVS